TAPAPYVDVIERHPPHPYLHLARAGGRRLRRLLQLELAVGNEGQRSHRSRLMLINEPRPSGAAFAPSAVVTRVPGSSPATRSGRRSRRNWKAYGERARRARHSAPRRGGSRDPAPYN